MPENPGTFELVALELGRALSPLAGRLHSTHHALAFLAELGLQLPDNSVSPGLKQAFGNIHTSAHALPGLTQNLVAAISGGDVVQIISKGAPLVQKVAAIIDSFQTIADELNALGAVPGINAADLAAFAAALPKRLFETALIEYFEGFHRIPHGALELIGVFDRTRMNIGSTDPGNPEFIKKELRLDRLGALLQAPDQLFQTLYGWGDPAFNGNLLIERIGSFLRALGIPVTYYQLAGTPPRHALEVCIFSLAPTGGANPPNPPGLEAMLTGAISDGFALDLPFAKGWVAHLAAEAALSAKVEMRVQPPADFTVIPPSGTAQGRLHAGIAAVPQSPATQIVLLGVAGGTGLTAKRIGFNLVSGFRWDSAANRAVGDVGLEGEISEGKLRIGLDGADGFLGTVLSGISLEADFDLGFGWTAGGGVYFTGSGALEVQLPAHITLGPIELSAITLSIGIDGNRFPVGLATDIKAALGPLQAVVEQVGASVDISFPADGRGDVGPLDLGFSFKPPKGVGLSLDVGVVKGGGYLFFDFEKEEYAGALELAIMDIVTVKAIGLVTTRMPDGSEGFSLLIIISAEFTGIQLGFGFTLTGLGGLLGLNRTMQLEVIAQGVRTGGINSIMFPKDIVANAPRIISDLRAYFPPQKDRFLIGLMAKIGWGTPTLASLSLGVIVEIPPGKVAILGILKVALPAEEAALIIIQVNFIGAIEPDKERLWFFAELFESRVLFIPIEGGMGLLVAWGDNANFVLSVGGFHPRFDPPPLPFPVPKRIALDILNTPVQRIRVEAYFAVTSNTVQFGARAELRLGLDEIGIFGHVAFDALFQFSPFYFIIEISASVELKVFGMGLFSIRLEFSLEGPTPWRAKGTGTLSLLFFDISADFDITWGDKEDTTLPPIEVIPLLVTEFNKIENWRAELPKDNNLLVSLRAIEETAGLVLHPVGILVVSQRAIPLGLDIAKVGSRKVSDAKRFSVKSTTDGLGKKGDRQEQFAMGQFLELDNAAKLSRKAYEKQNSGLELSVEGRQAVSSRSVKRIVRCEMIVIDTKYKRELFKFFAFAGTLFVHFLRGNAAARSPLSRATQKMFVPFQEKVKVQQEGFVVATNFDNKPVSPSKMLFESEATAYDFMNAQASMNPDLGETLHVIPAHEAVMT